MEEEFWFVLFYVSSARPLASPPCPPAVRPCIYVKAAHSARARRFKTRLYYRHDFRRCALSQDGLACGSGILERHFGCRSALSKEEPGSVFFDASFSAAVMFCCICSHTFGQHLPLRTTSPAGNPRRRDIGAAPPFAAAAPLIVLDSARSKRDLHHPGGGGTGCSLVCRG